MAPPVKRPKLEFVATEHARLMRWRAWQLDGAPPMRGYPGRSSFWRGETPVLDAYDPDEAREVDRIIAQMNKPIRVAALAYYLWCESYVDAAKRLRTNASTVRMRVYKAHGVLAEHFAGIQEQDRPTAATA